MDGARAGRKLKAALLGSMATPQKCILCGRPAEGRGMFFPKKSAEFGAPPGKTRVFIYAFCAGCWSRPDMDERVESYILRKAPSQEPERWN
jgi:hypothetical protein